MKTIKKVKILDTKTNKTYEYDIAQFKELFSSEINRIREALIANNEITCTYNDETDEVIYNQTEKQIFNLIIDEWNWNFYSEQWTSPNGVMPKMEMMS